MASQEKRTHKIPEFLKGMTSDGNVGGVDELARTYTLLFE